MKNLSAKEANAREMLCIPLDELESLEAIEQRIAELRPYAAWFKIGKASFVRFGPAAVKAVKKHGCKAFLDLKFHDIPNTVADASKAAASLGVDLFNVHASGGKEMMEAAVANKGQAKIIAVTVLTSLNDNSLKEININETAEKQTLHLAKLAAEAGMGGIVCSALDLPKIRDDLPGNFMFVTPGISGVSTAAGRDQKRVATPSIAVENGSSLLVVGRAITGGKTAEEREKAALEILKDMATKL